MWIGKNDSGQMLVLAGVIISISLITLASITSNLAHLSVPSDTGSSVTSEYIEVRNKFGKALKEYMSDGFQENNDNDDWIETYFDYIADTFTFVEMKHGFYFSAVYKGVNDKKNAVIAGLTLTDNDEYIYETVTYYLQ